MNTAPLLSVKELSAGFVLESGQILKAVDSVSFDIMPGECLGIVGESGCGKSVTAMSLLRLLPQPAGKILQGRVEWKGRDIAQMSPHQIQELRGGKIGIIFQEPMNALNPTHRIGDQIMEVLMQHQQMTKKEARQQAIQLLKSVKIASPEERLDEYPHKLSGGLRQRILIAMALACKPQLIIADEPTTALDVTVQQQILKLLEEERKKLKAATLLISHDFGVIAQNCDRVIVMYAGRIVEAAPVKEIFSNPRHACTKALLASMPRLEYPHKSPLPTIPGQVAAISDFVEGCRFCQRLGVPHKELSDRPPLIEIAPQHIVEACPRCCPL